MDSRLGERGRGRVASRRATLLLLSFALLPGLLLGTALGGKVAWLHAHGPAGGHLHVLAEQAADDHHGGLRELHDAQHRHESGPAHDDGEAPPPTGLRIDIPHIVAAPCGGAASVSAASVHQSAIFHAPQWAPALVEDPHGSGHFRSGWPPQRAQRSGVSALLRSNHALLI